MRGWEAAGMGSKAGRNTGFFSQLGTLFERDAELFANDRKKIMITFILPVVIGIVIDLVCDPDDMGKIYENTRAALFTIVCAAIYVGMFNSLTIICRERSIIKREYMTGMRLSSYVTAHTLFQGILCFVQALLFMAVYWHWMLGAESLRSAALIPGGNSGAFLEYLISLFLIMYASDMMGLLVSSIVKTSELANLVAPIIIIVQLVMSGVLFELGKTADRIADLTVSKWGMRALGSTADLGKMTTRMRDEVRNDDAAYNFIGSDGYVHKSTLLDIMKGNSSMKDLLHPSGSDQAFFDHASSNLTHTWMILVIFVAVMAAVCVIFLRRVEKDRR